MLAGRPRADVRYLTNRQIKFATIKTATAARPIASSNARIRMQQHRVSTSLVPTAADELNAAPRNVLIKLPFTSFDKTETTAFEGV